VHAPLLAALLTIGEPVPVPVPVPAPVPVPDLSSAAPSFPSTPPPALTLPRGGLDAGALAAPIVLLAGLAAAALVLQRRRRPAGRRVEVLETTSLGPKRSLVLARLGDELLLLGASEAGIHLLHTRPAGHGPAPEPAPELELEAVPAPEPRREGPPALGGLVARLRKARPGAAPPPAFDALLAESAEDQELRRKLARGQAGSVR
jgi:flagellar biogenesis protein FliO